MEQAVVNHALLKSGLFADFVIMERTIDRRSFSASCTLAHSFRHNRIPLMYKYSAEDNLVKCVVYGGNNVFVDVTCSSKKDARKAVAMCWLQELKKHFWTITTLKDLDWDKIIKISKEDAFSGPGSCDSGSVCLGGNRSKSQFSARVKKFLKAHFASVKQIEFILTGEFDRHEKMIIHEVCEKSNLTHKFIRTGTSLKAFYIEKKMPAIELLRYLKSVEGESGKYLLAPPGQKVLFNNNNGKYENVECPSFSQRDASLCSSFSSHNCTTNRNYEHIDEFASAMSGDTSIKSSTKSSVSSHRSTTSQTQSSFASRPSVRKPVIRFLPQTSSTGSSSSPPQIEAGEAFDGGENLGHEEPTNCKGRSSGMCQEAKLLQLDTGDLSNHQTAKGLPFRERNFLEAFVDPTESDYDWSLRKRFIVTNFASLHAERLICLSRCFLNMVRYGCSYSPSIMAEVRSLSKDICGEKEGWWQEKYQKKKYLKSSELLQSVKHEDTSEDSILPVKKPRYSLATLECKRSVEDNVFGKSTDTQTNRSQNTGHCNKNEELVMSSDEENMEFLDEDCWEVVDDIETSSKEDASSPAIQNLEEEESLNTEEMPKERDEFESKELDDFEFTLEAFESDQSPKHQLSWEEDDSSMEEPNPIATSADFERPVEDVSGEGTQTLFESGIQNAKHGTVNGEGFVVPSNEGGGEYGDEACWEALHGVEVDGGEDVARSAVKDSEEEEWAKAVELSKKRHVFGVAVRASAPSSSTTPDVDSEDAEDRKDKSNGLALICCLARSLIKHRAAAGNPAIHLSKAVSSIGLNLTKIRTKRLANSQFCTVVLEDVIKLSPGSRAKREMRAEGKACKRAIANILRPNHRLEYQRETDYLVLTCLQKSQNVSPQEAMSKERHKKLQERLSELASLMQTSLPEEQSGNKGEVDHAEINFHHNAITSRLSASHPSDKWDAEPRDRNGDQEMIERLKRALNTCALVTDPVERLNSAATEAGLQLTEYFSSGHKHFKFQSCSIVLEKSILLATGEPCRRQRAARQHACQVAVDNILKSDSQLQYRPCVEDFEKEDPQSSEACPDDLQRNFAVEESRRRRRTVRDKLCISRLQSEFSPQRLSSGKDKAEIFPDDEELNGAHLSFSKSEPLEGEEMNKAATRPKKANTQYSITLFENVNRTSFEVLQESAKFNKKKILVSYVKESNSDGQGISHVTLNKRVLASAWGDSESEARSRACDLALERLRVVCWCIKVKDTECQEVLITPDHLSPGTAKGSQSKLEPQFADTGSAVARMMARMGWSGGALGRRGIGILEPISHTHMTSSKRQGIGFNPARRGSDKGTIRALLNKHTTTDEERNWVFSTNFADKDLYYIRRISRRYSLESVSNEGSRLVLRRIWTVKSLLSHLTKAGGESEMYKLVAPAGTSVADAGKACDE